MNFRRWAAFATAAILAVIAALLLAVGLVQPARAQEPASPSATSGTLVIHVQDVSPRGGMLRLGLYDEARYPDDNSVPVAAADVRAEMGETVITLKGIAPGAYAIEAFQDVNSDNKMNTSWIGIPLEPFGFSRDARPLLSKPRFSAVKFDVAPGLNTQTLHLQNSTSLVAAR